MKFLYSLTLVCFLTSSNVYAKAFNQILNESSPEVADSFLVNYGQSINVLLALSHIEHKDMETRQLQLSVLSNYLRDQTTDALEAAKFLRSKREVYKSQYGYVCRVLNDDISTYIKDNQITKEEIIKSGLREIFLQGINFCEDLKKNGEINEEYLINKNIGDVLD